MREADDEFGNAPYCADDGKLQGRLKKSGKGIHDAGVLNERLDYRNLVSA